MSIFSRLRSVTAAVLATAAAAALALTAAPVATANPYCPALQVFFVPGTTETNIYANPNVPAGLMGIVGRNLQWMRGGVNIFYSPYQAAVLYGGSYNRSVQTGVDRTEHEIRQFLQSCPGTPIALGGYSQGADVAGNVASRIGNNTSGIPASAVRAVTLISDPHRGSDGEQHFGNAYYPAGSLGSRFAGFGALQGRVASFCQDGDLYCSAGPVTQLTMWTAQFAAPNVTDPELIAAIPTEEELANDQVSVADLARFASIASNELIRVDRPTEIPRIHFPLDYDITHAYQEYLVAQNMIETGATPHNVYASDWAGSGTSAQVAARYIADRF